MNVEGRVPSPYDQAFDQALRAGAEQIAKNQAAHHRQMGRVRSVVVLGEQVVGPFDSHDDALRWSIQNTSGTGDVRIVPLTPPAAPTGRSS